MNRTIEILYNLNDSYIYTYMDVAKPFGKCLNMEMILKRVSSLHLSIIIINIMKEK